MNDIDPLRDLRFEGMGVPQLLEWIGRIKEGEGPESMHGAVDALRRAARIVADLDEALRSELGELRIAWEGNAGNLVQEVAQQAAVVHHARHPLTASANGVQAQGEGYSAVRNSLPDQHEMRHHESENVAEWAGGAFGYESDYDQEARRIESQKQVARTALGTYRDTTVAQAERFRPMPELRPATVSVQSESPSSAPTAGGGPVGAAAEPGAVFVGSGLPRRSRAASPGGQDEARRNDGDAVRAGGEEGD